MTADEPTGVEHPPILRARGLVKRFAPATTVLHGVDLDVAAGEWVAVMGPSGSGKSTLLHLLGGLDVPTDGTVELAGDRLEGLSESARARLRRRHVGVLFQAYNLVPHLTALDNVALPIRLGGGSRREARRRAGALLDWLGVGDLATAVPATLSGGQAQRVALARAVANDVPLLLADEPTGALDTEAAGSVMSLLRQLHAAGTAIVMVTHDHRVASAADRVVVVQDGRIVDERVLAGTDDDPARASATMSHLVPLEPW
jgi:putative ABC transport system ATP-binding protein